MKRKKTILIFGISSFVGSNLASFLKDDYRIVGTYNKNRVQIPGVMSMPCDVLNKDEVQLALFTFKPDIAIYAAGLSSIADCEQYKDLANALNTSGLFNVVEYCQRYKTRICFISAGYVFSGEDKKYLEMDIPDPNTVYGKTQATAEFYVQKSSLDYLIFRSCNFYGRGTRPQQLTFFENMQDQIFKRKPLVLDNNVRTGFLDIYYLAIILKMAIEKNVSNRLFQLTSSDICTHYDFSQRYSEIFDELNANVSAGRWRYPFMKTATVVPDGNVLNFKMDTDNLEGFFKIKMPTIKESLELSYKRLGGSNLKKSKRKGSCTGITYI